MFEFISYYFFTILKVFDTDRIIFKGGYIYSNKMKIIYLLILLMFNFLDAKTNKIPYITNLIHAISVSNFDKDVIKAHKNKIYKQHYYSDHDYNYIGSYKDFAIFFFNKWDTSLYENSNYIYTSKKITNIQDAYILIKKEKDMAYIIGSSYLLGRFELEGVKDLLIYPALNIKAIILKQIKIDN
jgi:hypothetical protein